MSQHRRRTKVGDVFGTRVIKARGGKSASGRDNLWRWRCKECGSTGETSTARLRVRGCPKCVRWSEHKPQPKIGETIRNFVIIKYYKREQRARCTMYGARCLRCGAESMKRITDIRASVGVCGHCVNRYDVFGQLMTYKEIAEAFGVKAATIHARLRAGLSLEQAVVAPRFHAIRSGR